MDPKIRQLAEQANVFMANEGHPGYEYCPNEKEVEKFAQMIIDECCDVVIDCDKSPKMILHEPYRSILNKIQEHFGVTE